MPHAKASMVIQAQPERVIQLYRDYTQWPRLFPADDSRCAPHPIGRRAYGS